MIHGEETREGAVGRQSLQPGQYQMILLHPAQETVLAEDQAEVSACWRGGGELVFVDMGGDVLNHGVSSRKKASMAARSARTEPWANSALPPPRPERA